MRLNEETKDGMVLVFMIVIVFTMGMVVANANEDMKMSPTSPPDSLSTPVDTTVKTPMQLDKPKEEPKTNGMQVTATMYHPVEAQCDDTPDITADGSKIPDVFDCSDLNWIAVSQDLLWFNDGPFHYGDTVEIANAEFKNGIYVIRDAMNRRAKMKIDFLESVGAPKYKLRNVSLIQVES